MKKKTNNIISALIILGAVLLSIKLPLLALFIAVSSLLIYADQNLLRPQISIPTKACFDITRHNLYNRMAHGWQQSQDKNPTIDILLFHKANEHCEGHIELPELSLKYNFYYTTDGLGRRITSNDTQNKDLPLIAIFGCSYTWGIGISDEETFAWKLQEKFPDYKVINYGVAGFSFYEITLLLEQIMKKERPKFVIIAHSDCQDGRSTGQYPELAWYLGPRCLSLKLPWKKMRTLFTFWGNTPYQLFILNNKVSALKTLAHSILSIPWLPMNNPETIAQTAKHLFLKAQQLCALQESKLLVLSLESAEPYQEFFSEHQFSWCEFAPSKENYKLNETLAPFDNHYNKNANNEISKILIEAVDNLLLGKKVQGKYHTSKPKLSKDNLDFIYPMF